MNRSSYFGKTGVFVLALLALSISVFAQSSLRKALDVDNDGKADYSIFRPDGGTWWILKSGGGFVVQQWGDANDDYVTPGDFDGDGKGDIAVWRDTNGIWYRLNSATSTLSADQWGNTGDTPVARDFNGDGRTDLGIVRNSGGFYYWWVHQLSGVGQPVTITQWGVQGDFLAPGDYDGDGSFDVAIQRPTGATSVFWIQNAEGISTYSWGASTDIVVPGDYDGDGKTDIAVVREGSTFNSNLNWFIRRSIDSQFWSFTWGITGTDLTAQNDYDGDGKTDIAIWRNTDGNFWTLNPDTGAVGIVQWGAPNDRPIANYDTH